ncbi:hypothetical protein [Sphingobium sp. HWE2-09]|uniref:hypothetical protein n=1 Tax=Sphingobium sp. HWE2-09 TaxID=3108390 RepID=UPI002DC9C25A|nr:hypothetical protein [Sphingobium sp. HWE2-09]
MPSVRFGRKDEPATVLNETDEFIAVRTTRPVARRSPPVLGPLELELPDAALVVSFPEANVGFYRVRQMPGKTYLSTKAAIEGHQDVRFAGRVLVDEVGNPVVYTENLFVKFGDEVPGERCLATIAEHELALKHKVDYAINAFFVSADGAGRRIFEIPERLLERDDVEFAHPEIIRQRVAKRPSRSNGTLPTPR